MNPRLFGVRMLLIFLGSTWARDKPNANFRILIPRAFTLAYQIFTPTISTADIRQNMNLSHLYHLHEKIFAFKKFWNFVSTKYLHLGMCFDSYLEISILVPKNGHHSCTAWIYSNQFSPNIELTINLLKLQPK